MEYCNVVYIEDDNEGYHSSILLDPNQHDIISESSPDTQYKERNWLLPKITSVMSTNKEARNQPEERNLLVHENFSIDTSEDIQANEGFDDIVVLSHSNHKQHPDILHKEPGIHQNGVSSILAKNITPFEVDSACNSEVYCLNPIVAASADTVNGLVIHPYKDLKGRTNGNSVLVVDISKALASNNHFTHNVHPSESSVATEHDEYLGTFPNDSQSSSILCKVLPRPSEAVPSHFLQDSSVCESCQEIPCRCPQEHEAGFCCELCKTSFETQFMLTVHKKFHLAVQRRNSVTVQRSNGEHSREQMRPYVCKICNETFSAKFHLMAHRTIHKQCAAVKKSAARMTKQFKCTVCLQEFSTEFYLAVHLNFHVSELNANHDISGIPAHNISHAFVGLQSDSFNAENTTTHKKTSSHSSDSLQKACASKQKKNHSNCEKLLQNADHNVSSASALNTTPALETVESRCTHSKAITHSAVGLQNPPTVTQKENSDAPQESLLAKNVLNHFKQEEFVCKVFNAEDSLHNDEYNPSEVQCKFCCDTFETPSLLVIHQKENCPKKKYFLCEICSRSFFYKKSLQNHRIRHHSMEPVAKQDRKLRCVKPVKFSKDKKKLVQKKVKQSPKLASCNASNFTCHSCKRSFKTKKLLRVHEAGSVCSKPFKCQQCKAGFAFVSNLYRHQRKCHQSSC